MTTKATSASAAKDEPTNNERFYAARHELFFLGEVVKLAACAAAMRHCFDEIDNAGKVYPAELKKIHSFCNAPTDWAEMPHESLHWALNLAAQRMDDVANAMESAFMAAERATRA